MGHLKLKDGTTFPLNLSVGDIRDISKRSGAFSKTVTLVGDDDNNNLLNHYYDVNVQAGTFDINKLEQCQVIQNGIVILDNAYMQLVEVVKSQTTDAHNQKIEYKVLVKDSVSDFFTKLGNKTLNDINMQEIIIGTGSLSYEATNVTGSFNNTITDGYKFLMPQNVTAGLYNLKAFHPAMYAKTYFDAIFQGAGFTYEWGNQSPSVHTTNDNYFEKLVIPYNGGTPQVDRSDYLVELTNATGTASPFGSGLTWNEKVTGFTEVTDIEGVWDAVNDEYDVPFYIQNPENIQIQVEINYDLDLVASANVTRTGAGTLNLKLATKEQSASTYPYAATFYSFIPAASYSTGTTNQVTGGTAVITFNATTLDNADVLEMFAGSASVGTFSYTGGTLDVELTINSSTWKILPSTDTIGYQQELNLNNYVPKQIKQSDFIKSIFMMYNLYAEVDSSQPNKLILRSRDDYYDAGTERDWTAKLAKDSDQTLQFLPELSAKKMVLSYKDDKDDINEIYKEATNETYGQVEFTFENEYVKGIDRKELIFSPTPIVKTDFDAYVPALSYIPEVNVRILIDGGTQTCNEFGIVDYYINGGGYSGATDQTTAPLITHFDDPETPSFDLNFAVCDYYFYSDFSQRTNNNLYNLYWRRTLGQIDKGKMLTAFFDLNEVDIQSLKLNDKIRIDNSWWHINRVIDYDANEHKLTKVELISVDEEIEFTPFATTPTIPSNPIQPPVRPVRPVKPTKPQTVRPVQDIKEKNKKASNIYHGDSIVMGTNNYIGADVTASIILGDDNIVEENKILAPIVETTEKLILADGTEISNSSDITGLGENFANTDLTFDATHTHSLNGNELVIENSVDEVLRINDSEAVFNEDGANIDFRIEGDTDTDLIFVDASTDKVGIGESAPIAKLDVYATGSLLSTAISGELAGTSVFSIDTAILGASLRTGATNLNVGGVFRAASNANSNTGVLGYTGSSYQVVSNNDVGVYGHISNSSTLSTSRAGHFSNFGTAAASATRYGVYSEVSGTETGNNYSGYFINSSSSSGASLGYGIDVSITGNNSTNTALRLSSSGGTTNNALVSLQGGVVFNENASNSDFRIEGQTDANLFFVDASTDRVGIGTNTPNTLLDVATDISVGDSASLAQTVRIEGSRSSLPTTSDAYAGIFNVTGSGSWSASDRGDLHLHPRLSAERSVVMWTYDGSTVAKRFEVTSKGNVICGEKTALATTATDGFAYIPTCAGTPTGTPTAYVGKRAMVYDTTNKVLYIYSGGAWNAH